MTKRRTRKKGKPRGMVGRRPTGLSPGDRVSDYPRLTLRVPSDVRDALNEAAAREQRPAWRILVDAIRYYMARGGPSRS